MPSHYDTHAFDEQNTEDAAGKGNKKKKKKKDIKTPDNFGYGDMPADFRKRYKEMLEEHNKKKKKKK
tara:strand:- start:273 stop:473 length:201 start_codon:yes stop_codon:yes gene_type:complete